MRAVFGVVSLLIVLAVVGLTGRTALRAGAVAVPAASSGGAEAASAAVSVTRQQQVQRDVEAALRQGAARNDDAERREAAPADPAPRP